MIDIKKDLEGYEGTPAIKPGGHVHVRYPTEWKKFVH